MLVGCLYHHLWGFLDGSVVKKPLTNVGDAGSSPESRRFSWGRKWQSTSVFLTRKSHEQRSLVDLASYIVHRVINRWTWLRDWAHTHYHFWRHISWNDLPILNLIICNLLLNCKVFFFKDITFFVYIYAYDL